MSHGTCKEGIYCCLAFNILNLEVSLANSSKPQMKCRRMCFGAVGPTNAYIYSLSSIDDVEYSVTVGRVLDWGLNGC